MKERIDRLSERILKKYIEIKSKEGTDPFPSDREKKLSLLSPGRPAKKLVAEYYRDKLTYTLIASGAIVLIMFTVGVSRLTSGDSGKERILTRNDVGGGNYSLILHASAEDEEYGDIDIAVEERRLTKDECADLMDDLYERLLVDILPAGESLDHIDKDLYFPARVEGYPFSLRWESSDYLLVDSGGHVANDDIDEAGLPVDIKVIMTYRDTEKSYDIKAVIYPVALEGIDLIRKELTDALKKESDKSATEMQYSLPLYFNGKELNWKEVKEPVLPLIFVLGICLLFGIWFGKDRDLKNRYEERDRQLVIEYAEFVSKLQILLSSGSTIRKALERMAGDYKKNREKGGRRKYAYEELLLCVRKLGDGMSEAACYEYFGSRCGVICYKKLASILIQNLKKGTDGLIEAMDNEVRIAFEERKAVARRMGEEAQTKLMLPMMLMLSVVMIIIMIPAYLSFGGM